MKSHFCLVFLTLFSVSNAFFFTFLYDLFGMPVSTKIIGPTISNPYEGYQGTLNCYCGRNRFLQDILPNLNETDTENKNDTNTNDDDRIVGGYELSSISQAPWMAQILYNGQILCSGSVISDAYVLTAAHCVYGNGRTPLSIQSLSVIVNSLTKNVGNKIGVLQVKLPLNYYNDRLQGRIGSLPNDVALLRLNGRIALTLFDVRPLCLPSFNRNTYKNNKGKITGWGKTDDGIFTPASNTLKQGEVLAMEYRSCASLVDENIDDYINKEKPTYGQMCAKPVHGARLCSGDSGGPFTYELRGTEYVIGVTSYAYIHRTLGMCNLALTDKPDVLADMTIYDKWVRDNTRDGNYCKIM